MQLSPSELKQYQKHLLLPEIGFHGQTQLKNSRVLIIGAGGLGSPVAYYLAAAGIGHLGVIDFDKVESSNLQRQILYRTSDIGRPKVEIAQNQLQDLNPHIQIHPYNLEISQENAHQIISQYDLIIDGTDNFETRYLINDVCISLGKPFIYGSLSQFEGQVSVFGLKDGPCYRCLYPIPPSAGAIPNCAEAGVMGAMVGVVGTIQATEAIKTLLRLGDSLNGKLLHIDALAMRFDRFQIPKDPNCPSCGVGVRTQTSPDSEDSASEGMEDDLEISPEEFKQTLDNKKNLIILDVRRPSEFNQFNIGGIHIPLDELPHRLNELDKTSAIVAICAAGVRSLTAVYILREAGFSKARSLHGGLFGNAYF